MRPSLLGAALGLAASTYAQTAKYCPSEEPKVCYSVNVPSGGNGEVFFQIQGPSTKQWIGLGQGGQMTGSNIFIVYADAGGNNVTISPRIGKGNVQPDYNSGARVTLLEGSGIANGQMTANVRCANCSSWTGGTMDLMSSKSSWIWSVKDGSALSTNSQQADLQQHNNQGSFQFDLTKAQGGSSSNPFVNAAVTSTAAGGAAPTAAAAPAASNGSGGGDSSSGSGSGGGSSGDEHPKKAAKHRAKIAHAAVMGVAFVAFFPLGSMMIRIFSFNYLHWVHAGTQLMAYALAIAGLGLGAWIAKPGDTPINGYHPVIGIVVIALLFFQPFLGLIHHNVFKRSSRRSFWAIAHVWFGRILLTLGIIDGGLGLRYSGEDSKTEIAYGVIAGIVWLVWLAMAIWGHVKTGTTPSGSQNGDADKEYALRQKTDGQGVGKV